MKKNDKDLSHLYTVFGTMAFLIAGMPILEAIGTWVSNIFGLQSVKLQAEANKYAQDSGEEECGCHTQAVGFAIPDAQEEEFYDE